MILTALSGISLFLGGIISVKRGFNFLYNRGLQQKLRLLTNNFLLSVICGGLLTILIQSSSAALIIIIALLNSKLIDLKRAIALMMGANVGTTFTLQLISFSLADYSLKLIIISIILFLSYLISRLFILKSIAMVVLGLAFIYQGIDLLEVIAIELKHSTLFINSVRVIASYPLLGIPVGAFFTALIQSSSTFSGIIIILAKSGLIDLLTSVSLILGSNLGTCMTAVIAVADNQESSAMRLVFAHILFNILGILLLVPILPMFIYVISITATSLEHQIANAHTLFNLATFVIIASFKDYFIAMVKF